METCSTERATKSSCWAWLAAPETTDRHQHRNVLMFGDASTARKHGRSSTKLSVGLEVLGPAQVPLLFSC